jgi:hypothetical protein
MTQPYAEGRDTPTEDVPEATPAEDAHDGDAPQVAPAETVKAQTVHAETGPDSAERTALADGGAEDGPTMTEGGFGEPRVDDAVARLEELTERPVSEHAEVFDDVHRQLLDALEEAAVEPVEEPRG